ncbi:uncharacterized protein LOC107473093 [Arachis duranensis]|uniref:Uncharacterized protein LOC107473093 n=1 Tax=Arachis duranensis TaxID=130453 RepID=A0A6P4CAW5_ARADU|nr:uncharacterized protein LOC107473093 [Arachis duranensis]
MSTRGSERGNWRENPRIEPMQGSRDGSSGAGTCNIGQYYRSMTLIDFLKSGPSQFNGNANALEDDRWFRDVERFLYTQYVPKVQSVEIVTYMLEGDAQEWWQELYHTLKMELTSIPWSKFKTEFYGKYSLHAIRIAKELELMQLKQENMSVADYTREFDNLCHLSRVCQGNPADYEAWKCVQYEKGLRRDIFNCVERYSMKSAILQYGETTPDELHRARLGVCCKCGKPGHIARDCPHKKNRDAVESDLQTRARQVLMIVESEPMVSQRLLDVEMVSESEPGSMCQ